MKEGVSVLADDGLQSAYLALAGSSLPDSTRAAITQAGLAGVKAMSSALGRVDTPALSASASAALIGLSGIVDASETLGASNLLGFGATAAAALKLYEPPTGELSWLAGGFKPLLDGFSASNLLGDLGASTLLDGMSKSLAISKLYAPVSEPPYLKGVTEFLDGYEQRIADIIAPLQGYAKGIDPLRDVPAYGFTPWVQRSPLPAPSVDAVDEWLEARRSDLRHKRAGMWFAVAHSPDPVSQACNSAVELLLQLFVVCGITPKRVIAWAEGSPYHSEAVVTSNGVPRATWRGQLRFAAVVAGFDEVGQDLAASFADAPRTLQEMKHRAHRYTTGQVKAQLEIVDEILRLFAGRL